MSLLQSCHNLVEMDLSHIYNAKGNEKQDETSNFMDNPLHSPAGMETKETEEKEHESAVELSQLDIAEMDLSHIYNAKGNEKQG